MKSPIQNGFFDSGLRLDIAASAAHRRGHSFNKLSVQSVVVDDRRSPHANTNLFFIKR